MRNAKPFARPTKKKVPKVMSFVTVGQKLLGNLPPRAIQTMSEKDKKLIFVICCKFELFRTKKPRKFAHAGNSDHV